VSQLAHEIPCARRDESGAVRTRTRNQRGARGGRREEHRSEEQPAAQEDGGEKSILRLADAVAHNPDEPKEGDPAEWDQ
jgi:hypothetical protein